MATFTISTLKELISILKSPDFSVETAKDNYVFPEFFIHDVLEQEENIVTLIDNIMELPEKTVSELVELTTVSYKEGSLASIIDYLVYKPYFLVMLIKNNYISLAREIAKREFYINLFMKIVANKKEMFNVLRDMFKKDLPESSFWAASNLLDFAFESVKFFEKKQLNELISFIENKRDWSLLCCFLANPNLEDKGRLRLKKHVINCFIKNKTKDTLMLNMDIDFTDVLPYLKMDKSVAFLRKLKEDLFDFPLYRIGQVSVSIDFSKIKEYVNSLILFSPDILSAIQGISDFLKYKSLFSFYQCVVDDNREELITFLSDFLRQKYQDLPKEKFLKTEHCLLKIFLSNKSVSHLKVRICIEKFKNDPEALSLLEEFKLYIENKKQ